MPATWSTWTTRKTIWAAELAFAMSIPKPYQEIRRSLPDEVSFGCGGIEFFSMDEIESLQVGYSFKPDGSSLCTGQQGAWRPAWIVIGHETACGDPIFIDTEDVGLPVFTAMHGVGRMGAQSRRCLC